MEETKVEEQDLIEQQQNEAKYILNIGHWELSNDGNGNITPSVKIQQLLFKSKKEADDKYKKYQISKMYSFPTIVGNVSFAIISLEVVSIEKYTNWHKEQQELKKQQEESTNGESGDQSIGIGTESKSE